MFGHVLCWVFAASQVCLDNVHVLCRECLLTVIYVLTMETVQCRVFSSSQVCLDMFHVDCLLPVMYVWPVRYFLEMFYVGCFLPVRYVGYVLY